MRRSVVTTILCALLLTGCFKSISYKTTYVLKPWGQLKNQGTLVSQAGVKAYAFSADTADWRVASYEDALAGIITSKSNLNEKITNPAAVSEPFGVVDTIPTSVDWVKMTVQNPSMMIVAVDTEHQLYAYRQQPLGENLSPLYVSVTFQPWRQLTRYYSAPWCYVNDFYDPNAPKSADYILKPSVQVTQTDTETPLADVKAYAYAVDTTAWKVASYQDALAGIITSKENPQETQTTPTYTATPDGSAPSDQWLQMTVGDAVLMVVAVDTQHKLYAYCRQNIDWDLSPISGVVKFCPWKPTTLYVDGSWRMINEFYVAENPETLRNK